MTAITKGARVARRHERRETVLGTLRTGKRHEIRAAEIDVSGRRLVEFREWYVGADGVWHASHDHVSFPCNLIDDFASLAVAVAVAKAGQP